MISGETPGKPVRDMTGIGVPPLRPWQQPLTPEKIAYLQTEFAKQKAWIDKFWGTTWHHH